MQTIDMRSLLKRPWQVHRKFLVQAAILLMGAVALQAQTFPTNTQWVTFDSNGKLQYATSSLGDKIIDFSSAGYGGGASLIPNVLMATGGHVLTPLGNGQDDEPAIQAEINRVEALPLVNGFRGAIVLGPGTFFLKSTLTISASGIVLRGNGDSSSSSPTILSLDTSQIVSTSGTACAPGLPPTQGSSYKAFPAITIAGVNNMTLTGTPASITDSYAPSGTTNFNVYPHNLFSVGEQVVVRRPVTESWKTFLGMNILDDSLGCEYNPASVVDWLDTPASSGTSSSNYPTEPYNAITTTHESQYFRTVVATPDQYHVTLDAGIPDSFDKTNYGIQGIIQPYTFTEQIQNVGVENLEVAILTGYEAYLVNPPTSVAQPPYGALFMNAVSNAWVRNVTALNTFDTFQLQKYVDQVTFDDVNVIQNTPQGNRGNGPQFAHFNLGGEYVGHVLIKNTTIGSTNNDSVNTFFVEAEQFADGPNVVLGSTFTGTGDVGSHQRWATGLLSDNVSLVDYYDGNSSDPNYTYNHYAGFSARNASNEGTAHGWTLGWSVVWNSKATIGTNSPGHEFLIEAPPGATNWCIGCSETISTAMPDEPTGNPNAFPLPALGTQPDSGTSGSAGTTVQPQSLYVAQLLQRIGTFRLVNANSGLSMGVQNEQVDQEVYTGAATQQWTIAAVPGTPGQYNIVNAGTGESITFTTGAYGTQATTLNCGGNNPPYYCNADQFTVSPNFEIMGSHYNIPLVISGDSVAAGAAIVQEPQGRNISQEWYPVAP